MHSRYVPDKDLAGLILDLVYEIDKGNLDGRTWIDLGDPRFDRLPCSRSRLYRVARSHCHKWGYEYQPISHRSSRAYYRRELDNGNKINFSSPALIKVKT